MQNALIHCTVDGDSSNPRKSHTRQPLLNKTARGSSFVRPQSQSCASSLIREPSSRHLDDDMPPKKKSGSKKKKAVSPGKSVDAAKLKQAFGLFGSEVRV